AVRALSVLSLCAPLAQAAADILGADLEGVADVLEGEQPAPIAGRDPLARLVEHLPAARISRMRVLLVAVDRVLEHRQHEKALALEPALPAECREELCREKKDRV